MDVYIYMYTRFDEEENFLVLTTWKVRWALGVVGSECSDEELRLMFRVNCQVPSGKAHGPPTLVT